MGRINEAVDAGVAADTLTALQLPSACLQEVTDPNAPQYQTTLVALKQAKVNVSRFLRVTLEENGALSYGVVG